MPTTYYFTVDGEIIGQETGGTYTDYLTDALGSVTATVNSSPAVVNTYRHKPYGAQLAKTGAGADPIFRWNGSWGYVSTGRMQAAQYVRARHYGDEPGRWTTVDPLWPRQGAFSYCVSSPASRVDASGLQVFPPAVPPQRPTVRDITPSAPTPGFTSSGCSDAFKKSMASLCNDVLFLSARGQNLINTCIQNSASKLGRSCQKLGNRRLKCFQDFCLHGHIDCRHLDFAGYTPNAPLGQNPVVGCRLIEIDPTAWGSSLIPAEITQAQGVFLKNQLIIALHEIAHSCGVQHEGAGNPASVTSTQQCNDIFACCSHEIMRHKRTGSRCWQRVAPPPPPRLGFMDACVAGLYWPCLARGGNSADCLTMAQAQCLLVATHFPGVR